MPNQTLKTTLSRIETLRATGERGSLVAGLRRALADRSNIAVAKAAAIAAERDASDVIPDLLTAYERFFRDATETDPGCSAKFALARALKDLGLREPAPFVRGLGHVQPEPIWGGSADAAGRLRAVCADALAGCDIDAAVLLELLVDHLVDPDKTVRIEVAHAIAQTGGYESVLLLRLKALSGDAETDVYGACFDALLGLDGAGSVAFIERFIGACTADVAIEAVCSLAASRVPAALDVVQRVWRSEIGRDAARAIVLSCGASPLPQAGEWLLSVVADARRDIGAAALAALAASRYREALRERARDAAHATHDTAIVAAFVREFPLPAQEC